MADLQEAIESLESYGKTLLDTANKYAGIARTEIVELNRRIAEVRDAAIGHVTATNEETATAEGDEDGADKPFSRMNKAELIELAEDRGVEVADDATVADLRELLREE